MVSPVIDASGVTNVQVGAVSSKTINVTTTAAAGLLLIAAFNENAAAAITVSNVTAAGLTFTKRKSLTDTNASCNNGTIDVWGAAWSGGALSALTVTVTLSGTTNALTVMAIPITGCNSNTNPWDSNAGLPYLATTAAASAPPTMSVTTTQNNDLLLGFAVCTGGAGHTLNAPTGWTIPANGDGSNPNGGPWLDFGFYYLSVSAAQSAASIQIPNSSNGTDGYACIIDAVTANAASSTETATGTLAFGAIAFNSTGKIAQEFGTGKLAFGGIAFTGVGKIANEFGTGKLALGGIKIAGAAWELGLAGSNHQRGVWFY